MSEFSSATQSQNLDRGCFKEAVCIDAFRVYDSCADKDCLEDLPVYFMEASQIMVDKANSVRLKDVDVVTVYLDLEQVPFHKGFYSVDMTFFFEVTIDIYMAPASMPVEIKGMSIFNKKVVLYGSEGNVKIYSSDMAIDDPDVQNLPVKNLPKASVQVAQPIALSACLKHCCDPCIPCCRIPKCINNRFGGDFCAKKEKQVSITIGLFTIVQIERNVQMLIPAYDFCLPEKECVTSSDDPCEMFSRIDFPTSEFFPPKVTDIGQDDISCGCNCGGKQRDDSYRHRDDDCD